MTGITSDIHTVQMGVPYGVNQLVAWPVGATQQLYVGAVALVSGSGSVSTGYLKNAATAGSADKVAGINGDPAGGTAVQTGPGILGGSTDGAVWVNVRTGTFWIQSGTGANALSEATAGTTVYYGGENSTGPIANATGAGTSPVLGIQLPADPFMQTAPQPGSNYFPIKLNVIGGP